MVTVVKLPQPARPVAICGAVQSANILAELMSGNPEMQGHVNNLVDAYASAASADVHPLFASHSLNKDGQIAMGRIRVAFSRCLQDVEQATRNGPQTAREMAIIRTKLQEAAFFAVRAVAIEPFHQQEEPQHSNGG